MSHNLKFLSIKQASEWATLHMGKTVTASNISYLIQYGRIKKNGENGSTQIAHSTKNSIKMEIAQSNEILFSITVEDLQTEALEKIGRELNEEEIEIAKKGLANALLFDIDTVYKTIFEEMINDERN